jgi:hypothetical protein
LRAYLRQRANLIRYAGQHIQHMEKALEQMNLKLTETISDITGVTGQAIIKAIRRLPMSRWPSPGSGENGGRFGDCWPAAPRNCFTAIVAESRCQKDARSRGRWRVAFLLRATYQGE